MEEKWMPITGYEGLYEVSDHGRVKSLDRKVWNRANGSYSILKGKLLKLDTKDKPYAQVHLSKNGKSKNKLVHRLVAKAFVPNMYKLKEVNHLNENKRDNRAFNLMWVTRSQNINHGKRNKAVSEKMSKPVYRMSETGFILQRYNSIAETAKDGFHKPAVCKCCKGKLKTSGGYRWKYA